MLFGPVSEQFFAKARLAKSSAACLDRLGISGELVSDFSALPLQVPFCSCGFKGLLAPCVNGCNKLVA